MQLKKTINVHDDVAEIIFNEQQIQERVKELALKISNDYIGKQVTLVPILKGAAIFFGDLLKNITIPISLDFMMVSSYKNTLSSGFVCVELDLRETAENKNILIVEDIIDTGITVDCVYERIKLQKPKSIKICSLLDKPSRRRKIINIDYFGFEVQDKFVVGYGADFNEIYRNLPYISVLKNEIYEEKEF
ncbi:MAG TPA: hypoxanthine phosphoribosyltransferase [Elusimicrobia bacterium]|nr:hypoxanthine phosphoribosyltransferase [Elusimicrobiota bacterium]